MNALHLSLTCGILAALASIAAATGDFYEEPVPPLGEELKFDRLPARSMTDIIEETRKPRPAREPVDFHAEIPQLAKMHGPAAVEAIDRLLAAARERQHELGPGLANLLHDLRDLFSAGQSTPAEAAGYAGWRLGASAALFGIRFVPDDPRIYESEDTMAKAHALAAEIEGKITAASPALKPHWLYLRGAAGYKLLDFTGREFFEKVVDEFPKHPRAEAAQFMIGRCLLADSRDVSGGDPIAGTPYESGRNARRAAVAAFEKYRELHPNGRLLGDALGWLGALAWDGNDYMTALRFYLEQGAMPDHPEFTKPAGEMCERILSRLASAPEDAAFDKLAEHPAAALGLVYLICNSTESDNYNGEHDEVSAVIEWRKKLLPRVAAAIAHHEDRYRDAQWKPRYLAMLALAASGEGRHDEAVRLAGLGGESRDVNLVFARGVAMQRARRLPEAVAAFDALLREHPGSALADGVRFRLSLALFDNHQAGRGVALLWGIVEKNAAAEMQWDEGVNRLLTPVEAGQFRQLMDAELNFAPVSELAAALDDAALDESARSMIRGTIAERLLAQEKFAEARPHMPVAVWKSIVEPLADLTARAAQAKGAAAKAKACMDLADAWAAARGKVLPAPLDTEENRRLLLSYKHAEAGVRRAQNAAALGVSAGYQLEMENRDELRHAFNWWLAASDAQPKSALAAEALLKAITAMPEIADVSPFHQARAAERDWSKVSRALCDRLLKEAPKKSPERSAAVYWDFDPPPEELAWEEKEGFVISEPGAPAAVDSRGFEASLARLKFHADGPDDLPKLAQEIDDQRDRARRALQDPESARWINYLDDLSQAIRAPGLTANVFNRHAALRFRVAQTSIGHGGWDAQVGVDDAQLREDIAAAARDPEMEPLADFLAFLDLAVVVNHLIDAEVPGVEKDGAPFTWRTRDYPEAVKLAEQFLDKFPRSERREAALLVLARSLWHAMQPAPLRLPISWPAARTWAGGTGGFGPSQNPFDPKRIAALLDRHRREFPKGRYAADITNLRGQLALRTRDWPEALASTVPLLNDRRQPALAEIAAQRLGEIFDFLGDVRERPPLLAAIRASPRARERALEYAGKTGLSGPIRHMNSWLREELARR